jgi:iron(III) transport system permease protein
MTVDLAEGPRAAPVRRQLARDELAMRAGVALLGAWLLATVALPLYALLSKSLEAKDGSFAGLANYVAYFASPALLGSLFNTLWIAALSTLICVTLAFVYAYALTRSCVPGKGYFRMVAQVPILAPSLLPAISLVYLFGNQGVLTPLLFGAKIYGPIGVVVGEVFWTFPHALIILVAALSLADARHYEAAQSLGASRLRTFLTVTLPGVRYGLISAFFAVFTLVATDFGVPKMIGGNFNVLSTDIYKQVVGQQNFSMGAVVGVVLLAPAALAFAADRMSQQRQRALLTARAVPCQPRPDALTDWSLFAFCAGLGLVILTILGMAAFASFVRFWPYDLTLSLKSYQFDLMDGGGWASYRNSIEMSAWTAAAGTVVVFVGAYLVERTGGLAGLRAAVHFLCLLPLAVPGLVLGIAYVFFFNHPANPLGFVYGTMAILVLSTIAHFYSVAHLTAVTALKQIDPEFEAVSASLKVPAYRTFWRVTVPVTLPAILDIGLYLFVNAMTTVSAVVFLYAPQTTLASVAVLNMDDAGDTAPAAAMAMMIFYTTAAVRLLYVAAAGRLAARSQTWRRR